jgi:hypothetical protein
MKNQNQYEQASTIKAYEVINSTCTGGGGGELLNLPQCDIQDQAEGEKAPGALPTPADELATGHNVYEATVWAEMSYLRYDIIQRELIQML